MECKLGKNTFLEYGLNKEALIEYRYTFKYVKVELSNEDKGISTN